VYNLESQAFRDSDN